MKTIKTKLGSDKAAHICLYGKEIAISEDNFDDSGKAECTIFGEPYRVIIERPVKRQKTSAKAAKHTNPASVDEE